MFELILFDLDGTLTDPKEGITNCVKYALESFGITENDEQKLLKFIGPPLHDSFRDIYGFSENNANSAVEKYRERFKDTGIFENRLFDDTKDSLLRLKNAGKKIALATSKPYTYAEQILKNFEIFDLFDYKSGAELNYNSGSKDEIIKEALKMASTCDLEKAVMVGDRKYDIIGAKKCCIKSIGIRCGYAEAYELEESGADYIFNNLKEATDFIIGS